MRGSTHEKMSPFPLLLFLSFSGFFFCNFIVAEAEKDTQGDYILKVENPFTAKASLIRYWNRNFPRVQSVPGFLLSKASPLSAVESTIFSKLVDQNSFSIHIAQFCSAANLLCIAKSSSNVTQEDNNADFAVYENRNFSDYGKNQLGAFDSFKNYSDGSNLPLHSFNHYSHDSTGRTEKFSNYAPDGNVIDESFQHYSSGATGGYGEFKNYGQGGNNPNIRFTSYDSSANGKVQTFTSYSTNSNWGIQEFTSYGENGNGDPAEFKSYAGSSNIMESNFTSYGLMGNNANNSFESYGFDSNIPENKFKSYSSNSNGAIDSFKNYRDGANEGDDSFLAYAKESNSVNTSFSNYGKSFHTGTDTFRTYGTGATDAITEFKGYGLNNCFENYSENGILFSIYKNVTSSYGLKRLSSLPRSTQGKFFRESELKQGNLMPMPDIRDPMPKRSFLPRSIASRLPFSSSDLHNLTEIFGITEASTMGNSIRSTLSECEREPSRGETKQCVTSIEDMIDFAVSVLGPDIVVRTTENVNGSMQNIEIGSVKGINDGNVTKSVSCHQSLFPYLVYYCHSVPKVRLYQVEILEFEKKEKINTGIAICHLDTSAWSKQHGAFIALGSKPGDIEVCHWIFENDMSWAAADS